MIALKQIAFSSFLAREKNKENLNKIPKYSNYLSCGELFSKPLEKDNFNRPGVGGAVLQTPSSLIK